MEVASAYLLRGSSYDVHSYLPCSGKFLSTLALMCMGDSALSRNAFNLLQICFQPRNESTSIGFTVTYDVIRDGLSFLSHVSTILVRLPLPES